MDRGRTKEERSVILVDKGHYSGYGYLDTSYSIASEDELRYATQQKTYYPDADDLVRGFIKDKNRVKIISLNKED